MNNVPPNSDDQGWRKSSFSDAQGDCVELNWRKSSFSDDKGECVEVGHDDTAIRLRDTKNRQAGTLGFDATSWGVFLQTIKTDPTE